MAAARIAAPTNPAGARFCGNCGTNLGGAAAPAARAADAAADPRAGATERRVVSVLFADLVGFTTLSADRDPETMRELQDRYFERTRVIVDRYGGVIEKFIGDAVMAMWGAPVAHEDDAERAVRAGPRPRRHGPGARARRPASTSQVRVGVLTGEAAVTVGAEGQGMVTGDLVNTAARLQSVAPPGGVLVGEATRLAAEAAIEFDAAGEQELKGKAAPVAVVAGRPRRRRARRRATAGRARAAVRRPGGRAALPEGAVPRGRPRAARAPRLARRPGGHRQEPARLGAREVPRRRGRAGLVASRPLAVVRRGRHVLGARRDDPAAGRAGRGRRRGGDPRARSPRCCEQHIADETERAWIEPRILALLGIGETPAGGRTELFAAWRTFFERLAETGTVAFVVEDLQWSDDGLLDFLEHLLDWGRSSPIFVLTLARPELLERRPGWGTDRRGAISMRLDPLTDAAMRELLDGMAPGPAGRGRRAGSSSGPTGSRCTPSRRSGCWSRAAA